MSVPPVKSDFIQAKNLDQFMFLYILHLCIEVLSHHRSVSVIGSENLVKVSTPRPFHWLKQGDQKVARTT